MEARIHIDIEIRGRSRHLEIDLGWYYLRWWLRRKFSALGIRLGIIDPPEYNFDVPSLGNLLYEMTPSDVPLLADWKRAFGEETDENKAS